MSLLLTLVFAALLQLTLALHVRTLLTDAASEGARHAALYGNDLAAGRQRTAMLIGMTLPASYSENIEVGYSEHGDVRLVTMTVRAPLPLLGLFGPESIVTTGRAVAE